MYYEAELLFIKIIIQVLTEIDIRDTTLTLKFMKLFITLFKETKGKVDGDKVYSMIPLHRCFSFFLVRLVMQLKFANQDPVKVVNEMLFEIDGEMTLEGLIQGYLVGELARV